MQNNEKQLSLNTQYSSHYVHMLNDIQSYTDVDVRT